VEHDRYNAADFEHDLLPDGERSPARRHSASVDERRDAELLPKTEASRRAVPLQARALAAFD
jgi:hypothetical protein